MTTRIRTRSARVHVVILDENLPVPLDRRVWLEAQALRDEGFHVSVIGPRGPGDMGSLVERRDGIRILRYPQRAASGLAGYLLEYVPSIAFTTCWLLALNARRRIDVIHGCNPPDLFFILGRLGRLWGARYVFDQHDANPELAVTKWGDRGWRRWLVRLTEVLERASYRTAAAVIVPNEAYADIARTRGGLPSDRVYVVRNAPPAGHFRAVAERVEPRTADAFRIGYLGVMGTQDGVEILIDAIARLVRTRPDLDIRADLVGDGEARRELEDRVVEAGIGDRVVFHGYLRSDDFIPILAQAHVCVSPDPPTPFNDVSTMTKVVEYLAMGRPVVAFGLEETRNLTGSAGLIVEDATALGLAAGLERLADDPDELARLSDAAATRFEALDLSWERSVERLIAAYRRVTDET